MDTVIRVLVMYLFLMLAVRLLGKREFGQLSPLEFISLLLVPEIVSNAIQGENYSLVNAIVAICTLFALNLISSVLMHLNPRVEQAISGRPTVLAWAGRLDEAAMNRERVSPDELFSEMHLAGLERLDQVAWAILDADGRIAIIAAEPNEQQTPDSTPVT